MRPACAADHLGEGLDGDGLGEPGTPSSKTWPRTAGDQQALQEPVLADDQRLTSNRICSMVPAPGGELAAVSVGSRWLASDKRSIDHETLHL